jgi:D-alanyl-D-alanine carboxypeptidase
MVSRGSPSIDLTRERGQASLLLLGVLAALLAGTLILFGLGQALGARAKHQRAADLAAISAAQVMRDLYPRLFEPPFLEPGVPNPRHLEQGEYLELAREAAMRGARRNGARIEVADIRFPGERFAPTRVTVRVRSDVTVHLGEHSRRRRVPVRATATAELVSNGDAAGLAGHASGGGYSGPLAYRQGKPMRPDVALAFDRLAAAAREEAGLFISISSGFRSDAEQALLFAAHPDPKWVAPPGESLHRYATELDLGPPGAYPWLAANATRFGFLRRYAWEPWHYGLPLAHKPLATCVGAERQRRDGHAAGFELGHSTRPAS